MITHAPVLGGTTDYSVVIRVVDSTDGTPETAFTHNTSGIDLWYRRGPTGAVVSITEADLAAVDSAHADGGVEQIGNGYVRVDLPDAAVAGSTPYVIVGGTATGMIVIGAYVPIVAYNPADVVRLGLTSLPNAAAEASGGLYTRGTGAGQIGQNANGRINVDATAISTSTTAADNLETAALAYSATRGLAGTALPAAAADAAGGLPISDAGGLDLDAKLANTNEVTVARMGALTDWINGGRLDLLLDAIKVVTDAFGATAAAKFALAYAGVITGAAATGTLSTTQATSNLTGYTNDQLIGRLITFTSGPADGEQSAITDYAEASGLLTFDALTLAPENGNTFVIT